MLKLHHKLSKEDLWGLYSKVEMPLVPVLAVMETRGICVNVEELTAACELLQG